jgi:xanthine dehydrogenase molybdopterin-binding subunit B
MAQRLRRTDMPETAARCSASVVRMLSPEQMPQEQDFEQALTARAAAGENIKRHIGAVSNVVASKITLAYRRASRHTVECYERLARSGKDLASRTVYNVRRAKEARPLQLLAVIAGAAFSFGAAIRIWRSRHE